MQVDQIRYIDNKYEPSIDVHIRWDNGETTSLYFYHQSVAAISQAVESFLPELLDELSDIYLASADGPTTIGSYACYREGDSYYLKKDPQNTISFIGQNAEQLLLGYILGDQLRKWF